MFFRGSLALVIVSLLSLCFFLFLDLNFINILVKSIINERGFITFLFSTVYLFISIFFTWIFYRVTLEKYKYTTTINKIIKKDYFLDRYLFPKELSKIISKKYPHLKKNDIEEVLKTMKEFYRFQIEKNELLKILDESLYLSLKNRNTSIYMPSRVIDFACQTFFDMPNSSLFFKKLLPSYNKCHRVLPKEEVSIVLLSGQYEENINSIISDMWCYYCEKEDIDPFFPRSFPSFFTLDKRLKIPSGFIFELDEALFRETLPISKAPSIDTLKNEIKNIENINYLSKKIQYYLGCSRYCYKYQKEELEELFKLINKNQQLAHAVYGQYSDTNLFIKTVLNNSAPSSLPTLTTTSTHDNFNSGCCSGASI